MNRSRAGLFALVLVLVLAPLARAAEAPSSPDTAAATRADVRALGAQLQALVGPLTARIESTEQRVDALAARVARLERPRALATTPAPSSGAIRERRPTAYPEPWREPARPPARIQFASAPRVIVSEVAEPEAEAAPALPEAPPSAVVPYAVPFASSCYSSSGLASAGAAAVYSAPMVTGQCAVGCGGASGYSSGLTSGYAYSSGLQFAPSRGGFYGPSPASASPSAPVFSSYGVTARRGFLGGQRTSSFGVNLGGGGRGGAFPFGGAPAAQCGPAGCSVGSFGGW